jgi:hypothetical protein
MTKATDNDRRMAETARLALRGAGLQFYDPPNDEPPGLSMDRIQDHDFQKLSEALAVFVVWGPGAPNSRGMNAELEWAARVFKRPLLVWNPLYIRIEPWPLATIQSSGGRVSHLLPDLIKEAIIHVAV